MVHRYYCLNSDTGEGVGRGTPVSQVGVGARHESPPRLSEPSDKLCFIRFSYFISTKL